MNGPLLALAVAVGVVLAVWAHYAFWSWYFFLPTGEDELLYADSADGWRLAIGRRRPRAPRRLPPVLLVHGIAANRSSFDFGIDRYALTASLVEGGFECFSLDLRGHGGSRPLRPDVPRVWSVDDYVRFDVPAALDAVRAATGQQAVLWIGHSQGGLLGIAASALYPDRVAALVTLGSPVYFGEQDALKLLARLGFLLSGRLNRFLARSVAPFVGYWHLPVSQVAINGNNVTPQVYRRVLVNVVENISLGVMRQFGTWIADDTFTSSDKAIDYRRAMSGCRQPALFVAADADRVAPPSVVQRAAAAWGGECTVLRVGLSGAAGVDYGHSDLLWGKNAWSDVFSPVRDWMLAHSTPAEVPAAAAPRAGGGAAEAPATDAPGEAAPRRAGRTP